MVFFNYALRKLNAKIVYYGPGLCGKTTNLQWIHDHFEGGHRGEMISLATEGDRTIFFDLLPLEIGKIRGLDVTLQLYTVPGQVHYNSTRQLVLKGADGVVFVADSQRAMRASNLDSWKNLKENLLLQGIEIDGFPHVLQFNKRDLRDIMSVEELDEVLNEYDTPFFESVATDGIGVQETLEGIVKLVMRSLRDRYEPVADGQDTSGLRPVRPAGAGLRAAGAPAAPVTPFRPPEASPSVAPPAGSPVTEDAGGRSEVSEEAVTHPSMSLSTPAGRGEPSGMDGEVTAQWEPPREEPGDIFSGPEAAAPVEPAGPPSVEQPAGGPDSGADEETPGTDAEAPAPFGSGPDTAGSLQEHEGEPGAVEAPPAGVEDLFAAAGGSVPVSDNEVTAPMDEVASGSEEAPAFGEPPDGASGAMAPETGGMEDEAPAPPGAEVGTTPAEEAAPDSEEASTPFEPAGASPGEEDESAAESSAPFAAEPGEVVPAPAFTPGLVEPEPAAASTTEDFVETAHEEAPEAGGSGGVDELVRSALEAPAVAGGEEGPFEAEEARDGDGTGPEVAGAGTPAGQETEEAGAGGARSPVPAGRGGREAVVLGTDEPFGFVEHSGEEAAVRAEASAVVTMPPGDLAVPPGDGSGNQLQLRIEGTQALARSGDVRELDIMVPVPGTWIGNRRVTLQLRLTLVPSEEEDE